MMKKLIAALLFLGCLMGGAVSASVILLIVSFCVFGLGDFEAFLRWIEAANPIAGVMGAMAGAIIFSRSAKRTRQGSSPSVRAQ